MKTYFICCYSSLIYFRDTVFKNNNKWVITYIKITQYMSGSHKTQFQVDISAVKYSLVISPENIRIDLY